MSLKQHRVWYSNDPESQVNWLANAIKKRLENLQIRTTLDKVPKQSQIDSVKEARWMNQRLTCSVLEVKQGR